MSQQYLEDLAELAYKYREARQASRDAKGDEATSAANEAITKAANNLLAFAAAEEE